MNGKNSPVLKLALLLFVVLSVFAFFECAFRLEYLAGWHLAKVFRLFLFKLFSYGIYVLPIFVLGRFSKYYFVFVCLLFFPNILLQFLLTKYMGIENFSGNSHLFEQLGDFVHVNLIRDFCLSVMGVWTFVCIALFSLLAFGALAFVFVRVFRSEFYVSKFDGVLLISLLCFVGLTVFGVGRTKYAFYVGQILTHPWFVDFGVGYYKYTNTPHYLSSIDDAYMPRLKSEIKTALNSDIVGVVMVGESLSRIPLQSYGYKRENTPKIEALRGSGNLFLYNGETKIGYTTGSLLTALTFCEFELPKRSVPVAEILKNSDITTYLLSSVYHTELALKRIFSGMEYLAQVPEGVEIDSWHDDNLLPPLREKISKSAELRNCFFMHFQGSHFNFDTKYPESFKVFDNVRDQYTAALKPDEIYTYNTYDNTVLYFDYIFASVVDILKSAKKPAFLLYFSDHGEGYSRETYRYQPRADKNRIYNVPVIVWVSDEYAAQYGDVVKALKANENKFVRLDKSVLFTLLNLLRIELTTQGNNSLATPNFMESK